MSELRRVIAAETAPEAETHVLCDVVFVHGLRGTPNETWRNDVNDMTNSWPFWIAADHPSIAVWSFGYDASNRPNAMPIPQRAEDFLTTLQEKRFGHRPLVLIGHSMGGLLIKQAIHMADGLQEPAWKAIAETIRLLVFVSTPHHGATLATYLNAVTRMFAHTPVEQLVGREANLRLLNNWFRSYVDRKRPTVVSFFETKPSIVGIVVNEVSADFGFPNHICRPVDDDHSGSSKPLSRESRVAAITAIELEKLLDDTRRSNVSTAVSPVLRYTDDTHILPDCIDSVLGSEGRVGIEYFEEVALTARRLRMVARNPQEFLARSTAMRKKESPTERSKFATEIHRVFNETNDRANRVIDANQDALNAVIASLRRPGVPTKLMRESLATFASLAALRLITVLQDSWEIDDSGRFRQNFEHYLFDKDLGPPHLERVPKYSNTGALVFEKSYYVRVRIGPNFKRYEQAVVPLDVARRLFAKEIRGDTETFYRWILPQLLLYSAKSFLAEEFAADQWEVLRVEGAYHQWRMNGHPDPWPNLRG